MELTIEVQESIEAMKLCAKSCHETGNICESLSGTDLVKEYCRTSEKLCERNIQKLTEGDTSYNLDTIRALEKCRVECDKNSEYMDSARRTSDNCRKTANACRKIQALAV